MIGIFSEGIWKIPSLLNFLLTPCQKISLSRPLPAAITSIAVWGYRPGSLKAAAKATAAGLPVVYLEDGFLRSLLPGVAGCPPLSLVVDEKGIYYDARTPSTLERLIQDKTPNATLAERAQKAMRLIVQHQLSKYNHAGAFSPPVEESKAVLVVDQTRNDMSVTYGNADERDFMHMLETALRENPHAAVWVKVHPDVLCGKKRGYLSAISSHPRIRLITEDAAPLSLLQFVERVYVVTSQYGFEALLAGKPVVCFGQPWYAGWGLTDDRHVNAAALAARRQGATLTELFIAAYLRYSRYIHPATGLPGTLFDVIDHLILQRQFCESRSGLLWAPGLTLWKRAILAPFLRCHRNRLCFTRRQPRATACVVWGVNGEARWEKKAAALNMPLWRMEDGFLRSVGLGSALHPPLSLVLDKRGIYYDATRPSDLETMLQSSDLSQAECLRADRLRQQIVKAGLCKYNHGIAWQLPDSAREKRVLLVPGQVEDDASLKTGASGVTTNLELLRAVRQAHPDAFIIYKPHPDVISSKRPGAVANEEVYRWADCQATEADIITCIRHADEIHTITSLCGFEALLHGKQVWCYGMPFYAGWGLTQDALTCVRRTRKLTLNELVYHALIAYPTYIHPQCKQVISAEEAVAYLISSLQQRNRPRYSKLARYQRLFRALFVHFGQ